MDPLSDVLSLLKPRSSVSAGMNAGGPWSVRFDQHVPIKCYAVVSGQCWLAVDGVSEPLLVKAGESFLLPGGRPFRLTSDLSLTPTDSRAYFPPAQAGGVALVGSGGEFFLVGSRFALSGDHNDLLLGLLPPIVHLHKKADRAAMRWSVERMRKELREQEPGSDLITQHLAHMMLIQALRVYMSSAPGTNSGWLFAAADKQMGAALRAIHADPAHGWTVQTLAERAGMSRSAFAQRFKAIVGASPVEYLTRWRMLLAGDRLAHSADPVSVVALSLGYESESAFSAAFKRVMGRSPRRYSLQQEVLAI
ncbi:AraC family transcriptional regulator [Deinococcus sp. UYEF24]